MNMLVKLQDVLRKFVTVYEYKDGIRAFEDMMTSKLLSLALLSTKQNNTKIANTDKIAA